MKAHRAAQDKGTEVGQVVKLLNKLQNPFALVVQGFLVGGLLFWAAQGEATPAPSIHASAISPAN